jgi:lipoprotein-anchoring transpeptidase ErfK/SrfK
MTMKKISRRGLVLSSLALVASGCMPARREVKAPDISTFTLEPRLRKQRVAYQSVEAPGSIIVNTSERYLYYVEGDGWATRYGVAVGEEGLSIKGRTTVGRKAEWPSWTPTASMIERKPWLEQYANGVPGGPNNPLGARALYLYQNGQDTKYRLHGTNEPWTIGTAVSNGCIRMTNDDVVELYDRTPEGSTVIVI